jgi:hypothetical protein
MRGTEVIQMQEQTWHLFACGCRLQYFNEDYCYKKIWDNITNPKKLGKKFRSKIVNLRERKGSRI